MNRFVIPLIALLLLGSATARAADAYLAVKVVDRADVATYKVMTPAELKALQVDYQEDTRLMPKALALTRKAWDADPANTKSFPGGAINRLSADAVGPPYKEQADAEEKVQRLLESAATKQAEAADKAKAKIRAQYSGEKRAEKTAEAAADARDEAELGSAARTLYEAQLATLKGAATAAAKAP